MLSPPSSEAVSTAAILLNGYLKYMERFRQYTQKAPEFFKSRDWNAMHLNHRRRLRLYKDYVKESIVQVHLALGEEVHNLELWKCIKIKYTEDISMRDDKELCETFYNSVLRKVFPDAPIHDEVMFVYAGYASCDILAQDRLYYSYPVHWGLRRIIRAILDDFDFEVPYMEKEKDVQFLVRSVREVILTRYKAGHDTITQVLKSVFYRNKAAYLIGRTFIGGKWMPFIIPFLHGEKGVYVDTLIFDPSIMSHMFSFTRSYFMVEAPIPSQMVAFLNSVITHKQIHELYNAIGFNKHGKTEFYRDFLTHLKQSEDQFIPARGIKGMVMTVFTLPSYNIVFKLIKDHFEPPKNMTRQEVREKYKLVGLHDRVGRMADTHEFENFSIPLDRVHSELMQELRESVNSLIRIEEDRLILKHLYTERKMIPLNIYLEEANTEDARYAVEEYGNAIIQLAKANIFPGDMMTKNFGVTSQKRVIFYDYDEIEFLTNMNFRHKPKAKTYEQIYASSPWYDIAPNDVFPEDFKRFMIGRADVKPYFLDYHQRLFDPEFWKGIQEKIKAGESLHAFPYPKYIRFRPEAEL